MDVTDHLLGVIYEAALDAKRWPDALAMLADVTGGVGAHVAVLDKVTSASGGLRPRLKVSGAKCMDPDVANRYMREWHVFDPLLPAAGHASGPPGTILLCQDFLSDDFVAHNMYFQDFLIPSGGRYQAGVTLLNDQDRVAVLDLHSRVAPFRREQLMRWSPVMAHLRRAVHLGAVLTEHSEREALLRKAIDQRKMACVMVNVDARVVDHSEAAGEMLARGDGLCLDAAGKIRLGNETATLRLRRLIAQACRGHDGGAMPLDVQKSRLAVVQVVPAGVTRDNPFSLLHSDCALLFIEAARPTPSPDPHEIRLALKCTPAEAEVAAALATGRSPAEIAAQRATSVYTVRAQIHSLLEASGTHRMAELVGVIHMLMQQSQRVRRNLSADSRPS